MPKSSPKAKKPVLDYQKGQERLRGLKRIIHLEQLRDAAMTKRSVLVAFNGWSRPFPASWVFNFQGQHLLRLFNEGMYLCGSEKQVEPKPSRMSVGYSKAKGYEHVPIVTVEGSLKRRAVRGVFNSKKRKSK